MSYRATSKLVAVAVIAASTGCTRWTTTQNYGPPREVARRLLGEPSIAETRSAGLSASFAGRSRNNGMGTTTASGGLGGNMESITLKHCVQQAEVSFEQPYEVRPQLVGRAGDIVGAVVLGLVGIAAIDVGMRNSSDDGRVGNDGSPVGSYIAGGVFLAGAGALLVYSFGIAPKKPAPAHETRKREWVETKLVEATGCTQPPNVANVPVVIQPQPAAKGDAAARLEQLDKLRAAGAINDQDYQRKRKEIIDSI